MPWQDQLFEFVEEPLNQIELLGCPSGGLLIRATIHRPDAQRAQKLLSIKDIYSVEQLQDDELMTRLVRGQLARIEHPPEF